MARAPSGDPRLDRAAAAGAGVRPLVAPPARRAPTLLIAGGAIGAGLALFLLLDGHRRALEEPAVRATAAERAAAAGSPALPPLYLPPQPVPPTAPLVEVAPPAPAIAAAPPPPSPRIVYVPQPATAVASPIAPPVTTRERGSSALVIDNTAGDGSAATTGPGDAATGTGTNNGNVSIASATTAAPGARARAIILADQATTVAQGTLIPAVLETAFDSTRPGLARAVVSRDVRGFDGSRVLIPRGSKLTGDYRSDVASGQNRALIVWTRLVRPDGATIALASPAADTLGRGGVKGHVNTHVLARFTGAILQSALTVGVNLASRPANGTVVLGLPGSTVGTLPGFNQNNQVTNTLTVRAGTSIAVLVARDLDFADVEGRR